MSGFAAVAGSFFSWVEHTDFSQWIRGGSFAFPVIITVHVLAASVTAGTGIVISLRLMGAARGVPLSQFERFYPVLWSALTVAVISGLMLLDAYPYKALTNPVFYAKMIMIVAGVMLALRVRNGVLRQPAWHISRTTAALENRAVLALLSLTCWAGALICGRLLAYTYKWLLVGMPAGF